MPRPNAISKALLAGLLAGGLGGCACGDDLSPAADAGIADAVIVDARPTPDAPILPDASPGSSCVAPLPLVAGVPSQANTGDGLGIFAGSCSVDSNQALDLVFSIDVGPAPADLIANVVNDGVADPPFDPVLYTRTFCASPAAEVGCSDVDFSERLETLAVTDVVYVFVDGTDQFGGASDGAFTLTATTRAIVGDGQACDPAGVTSRCDAGFVCVASVCVADDEALACSLADDLTAGLPGPVERTGATHIYESSFFAGSCAFDDEAEFDEDIFAITVPQSATLVATTDFAETNFDTYLYLHSGTCGGGGGVEVGCADDIDPEAGNFKSTLTVTGLAAGTYFLFVDGSSASPGTGDYRLSVTVTTP